MADVTVDLFKFVTVRAAATVTRESLRVIRDARLGQPAVDGQIPDMADDAGTYVKSAAAIRLHGLIIEHGSAADTPQKAIEANQKIARAVAGDPAVVTETGLPHVDAVTAVLDRVSATTPLGEVIAAVEAAWPFPDDATHSWRAYAGRAADAPDLAADRPSLDADLGILFDRLYLALVAKRQFPLNLEHLIRALRTLGLLRFLAGEAPRHADLAVVLDATPAIHRLVTSLVAYYRPFNPITPVGIGDLLVVKQFLCRYEAGEVAHIENVLDGESKVRRLNRIDQVDELVSVVEDTASVDEREVASTQRFELKSETEATIQSDLSAQVSGQVSGRYGVVEYSANAGVSYSTASTDSRRGANNFAKDVVDRSLSRIQTTVREERTSRRLSRTEELNRHELTNNSGTNLAGVYRWVDKVYRAQVFNYGKRLMFEFVIPEPAAFALSVFEHNRQQEARPDVPQKPSRPNLDIATISAATVSTYGQIYNLSGLDPEPPLEDTIAVAIPLTGLENQHSSAHERQFTLPDGYAVTAATIDGDWSGHGQDSEHGIRVSIGGQTARATADNKIYMEFSAQTLTFAPPLVGSITAVVYAYRIRAAGLSVALKIKRTDPHYREWQLSVYQAIMDAYDEAYREYQSALGEYESDRQGYEISQGVIIKGRNPRVNQELIRTELRKSCLSMIALQFDSDKTDDITFDAMKTRIEKLPVEALVTTTTQTVTTTTPDPQTSVTVTTTSTREDLTVTDTPITMPAIDVPEAVSDGQTVQFLEQAFEWQQISYVLYPYFWGKLPGKWYDAQKYYDEVDPLYARFLQAGAARVLVAVRPGFEAAVQHYLYTREPWNGGPVPDIDDPLYLAVHAELRDQQDDLNHATPYGVAWSVVVPTLLLYLQADATLPTFDCGEDSTGGETADQGRTSLWTGTARPTTATTLPTGQTAWVDWPAAAQWQVPVPEWATDVDFLFTVNPRVAAGDVFGELRLTMGDVQTTPTTFDVNYEADQRGGPEQAVLLTAGTHHLAPEIRGKQVIVKLQAHMLDPSKHTGRLEAAGWAHLYGQMNFKRHPPVTP